jgi:hypothetical protein
MFVSRAPDGSLSFTHSVASAPLARIASTKVLTEAMSLSLYSTVSNAFIRIGG